MYLIIDSTDRVAEVCKHPAYVRRQKNGVVILAEESTADAIYSNDSNKFYPTERVSYLCEKHRLCEVESVPPEVKAGYYFYHSGNFYTNDAELDAIKPEDAMAELTVSEKLSRKDILALRRLLEAFVAQADDATASIAPKFSQPLPHDGKLVRAGTRVNVDGILYKAAVDLWDTEENSPENAPTLWAKLAYRDGYRIIPNPDGGIFPVTEAFAKGERGWWGDTLMESTADGNCYTPEVYADYWTEVSQ